MTALEENVRVSRVTAVAVDCEERIRRAVVAHKAEGIETPEDKAAEEILETLTNEGAHDEANGVKEGDALLEVSEEDNDEQCDCSVDSEIGDNANSVFPRKDMEVSASIEESS